MNVNTSSHRFSLIQTEHFSIARELPYSNEVKKLYQDDAIWIITSSFIIFTMHSGFGLLESGSVAAKDEVNIMVKNVVDVVFGGLTYWSFGYGLSFGDGKLSNAIIGWGKFFYNPVRSVEAPRDEGWAYANFLFQLSFATTASTIVSGAVAERAKLKSYILLGCAVIVIQALPAHWVWDPKGVFFQLGVVDFAGCSCIHMVGGIIGLMATIFLKPRRNRFSEDSIHQMSSPTNALLGTFMLWWGWFGINSGAAWGVTNGRWRLAARASVATIMSSIGGGATAIVFSFIKTKKLQVNHLIYGLLSSVVSITAICAIARPWHALLIGSVSSAISVSIIPVLEMLKIDDPVGVVPIHLISSMWGMCAVGIFAEDDQVLSVTNRNYGLLYSGSFQLLAIQAVSSLAILVYSAVLGLTVIMILCKSPLGLRVTDYEEQIGADNVEHGLAGTNIARYHIEKPLSSKTFATVTKAITKWKIQTRRNRALRQQQRARYHGRVNQSHSLSLRGRDDNSRCFNGTTATDVWKYSTSQCNRNQRVSRQQQQQYDWVPKVAFNLQSLKYQTADETSLSSTNMTHKMLDNGSVQRSSPNGDQSTAARNLNGPNVDQDVHVARSSNQLKNLKMQQNTNTSSLMAAGINHVKQGRNLVVPIN